MSTGRAVALFLLGVLIGVLLGYYAGLSSAPPPAAAERAAATAPAAGTGEVNATAKRAGVNMTADVLASLGETVSLGPWKITVYGVEEARCVKSISSTSGEYWLFASYYCARPGMKIVVVRVRVESDDPAHASPFGGCYPCIPWYPELITNTGGSYESKGPGAVDGMMRISAPGEDVVMAAVTYRYEGFIEGTVTEDDFGYVIPEGERPAALRMVYATLDRDVTVVVNLTCRAPDSAVRHSKTVAIGRVGETVAVGRWRVAVLDVREALCVRVVLPGREEYCGAPRGGKAVLVRLAFENAGNDAARLVDYFVGGPTLYTGEGIRIFPEKPCSYGRLWLPCSAEERANAIDYSPRQSLDSLRYQEIGPGERVTAYVLYVIAEGDAAKRLYIVYEPRYERRKEVKTVEIDID
ncbi:MAG: DUF4352 domain-containing protein [Thermoproteaceae archaeon]|nr:DUF4352 domain-containing protein [Thermoproteaceae archaeon]